MTMASPKYKNKSQTKRWVIMLCIILAIIFSILYFYKWYQVKEQEKYLNSYLITTNTISQEMTDINEISSVLSETGSYYFVYIGYTKDEKIYEFEKDLKPIIDKYDLHNNFYYINVTDIKEQNKNYLKALAKELNIKENELKEVPTILYFNDGELIKGVYNIRDFKNLLTTENIDKM